MIKAIFFDLDGTLLPMNEELFTKKYFSLLCNKFPHYEKEKLISTIYEGTMAMYKNDGRFTNEEVFWNVFKQKYGNIEDKPLFDEFYVNEFKETQKCCLDNPLAKQIVDFCNEHFEHVILSTNPIFPLIGTLTRMSFVGLKKDDFDFITSYENSSYCKPNPMYFKTLLDKFNLKPEEVILFGNNTLEDGECSYACGIKCYMVGDFLIKPDKVKHTFKEIKMKEVIPVLKEYID